MTRLYLAGGASLYLYDLNTGKLETVLSKAKESLMGLSYHGEELMAAAKSKIFRVKGTEVLSCHQFNARPDFHRSEIYDGTYYITCTAINEVWTMTPDDVLNFNRHAIAPPLPGKVKYKDNYNHLNSIFMHDDKFYVCLNWLTSEQYGPSGVAVLDESWKELDRFEYGWEAHSFRIIEGLRYVICGSSGLIKDVNHPYRAGLLVDGELAFEHPTDVFCKDFCVIGDYIYMVGGGVAHREARHKMRGVLYILDRNLHKVDEREFEGSGGFCGVIEA